MSTRCLAREANQQRTEEPGLGGWQVQIGNILAVLETKDGQHGRYDITPQAYKPAGRHTWS